MDVVVAVAEGVAVDVEDVDAGVDEDGLVDEDVDVGVALRTSLIKDWTTSWGRC